MLATNHVNTLEATLTAHSNLRQLEATFLPKFWKLSRNGCSIKISVKFNNDLYRVKN